MGQRTEFLDVGVPEAVEEPLDQPAVQRADNVRIGLCERPERAVGERHHGGVVIDAVGHDRVEADAVVLAHQRFERTRCVLVAVGVGGALARPISAASDPRIPASSTRRRSMFDSNVVLGGSSPSDGASAASE